MKRAHLAGRLVITTFCAGLLAAIAYALQLAVIGAMIDGFGALLFGILSLVLAVPAFLTGAAVFGPGAWLMLRRTKLNRPVPAALIGGGVTLAVGGPLFVPLAGMGGLAFLLAFPLSGGVGGWVFQHMMDERPRTPSLTSPK